MPTKKLECSVLILGFAESKGGSVEEWLYKKTSLYSKFEFSFSVTLFLPFKAELVFCSEELSFLPNKNQNKGLTLSFGEGKVKFAVL